MMSSYLKNSICEFEILSSWDIKKKHNILSTSFFKMGSHYKNFDIYVRGLKKLIKLVEEQNNYVLRIFIDPNIKSDKEIYPILAESKKVQIIMFKCFNYMDNSNFHIDVFGAMVRLFPLFDFENNEQDIFKNIGYAEIMHGGFFKPTNIIINIPSRDQNYSVGAMSIAVVCENKTQVEEIIEETPFKLNEAIEELKNGIKKAS